MLTIRAATPADKRRWLELWAGYNAFYEATIPAAVTDATWRRILDADAPIKGTIAELDGKVVGFANAVLHESTWTLAPVCYLEDLFVDPAARRAGVARSLMKELVERARSNGWSTVYWHTRGNNITARRLYDTFASVDDFVRYQLLVTPGRPSGGSPE
jgi:GNAT superfamily N-acetyltransferase